MRSSMLLSLTAALFSIINGVHASPLAPRHDPDIIGECALPPHAHLGRRGPVKIPSGIHPAAKQFIEHMSKATIMHGPAPMFWAGKIDRTGALSIANKVKKVQAIVGTHGAHTVFDVLESEEASHFKGHTAQWKPGVEWAAVCAAFAEYSKPTGKKGFLVFGTEFDPTLRRTFGTTTNGQPSWRMRTLRRSKRI
ncbi:hypothetical protein BDP27DRAFT_1367301 [Rhodocollybia butyracea]|uniref:Uncharacterized protein n=1 Tax=Rhodocollybia butyracea TaxID=206335 RepID=A0A9P5U2V9_9AGAR|nr:hypothetical protein BDP27DRAFT_1367301 [Rhodocollybia butyracea]